MTTSGTYTFSLDIDEVIQEAMEMIGGEQTLGHDPKSARRSIIFCFKTGRTEVFFFGLLTLL